MGKQEWRNPDIVVDQVPFGEARLGIEDLLEICHLYRSAADIELGSRSHPLGEELKFRTSRSREKFLCASPGSILRRAPPNVENKTRGSGTLLPKCRH